MNFRGIVVLALGLGAWGATARAGELARLLKLAEAHSPVIQKAEGVLKISELQEDNAVGAFWPTLDLSASHGLAGSDPASGSKPWTSQAGLDLNENFYDNGASLTKYQLAKFELEQSRLQFKQDRDTQLLNIANAYWEWSRAIQLRRASERKRDLLRHQYDLLKTEYHQGLKTRKDVLRIETELQSLEISLLSQKNDIDLDFKQLAAAVGVDAETLRSAPIEAETPPADFKPETVEAPLQVEANRKAKIDRLLEKQSRLNTNLVRRQYWPQLGMTGEVTYGHSDYLGTGLSWRQTQAWNWSALVTLKYNLWDSGVERRNLEIARIQEQNVSRADRQDLLDLGNQLREVELRLSEHARTLNLTHDLLQLEQQSYSTLEREYRAGKASYLDLITGLNSLIDARTQYLNSYFDWQKQRLLYAFHKGNLHEEMEKR